MQIEINKPTWKSLDEVPLLTLDWAKVIGGQDISLEEIKILVETYEDWLADHN